MLDVIAIGTATRDVFLRSSLFKVLKDKEHLEKLGFPTGEAECFAMGSKIDVSEIVFTTGGGATNAAVTFGRQGLKTAALISVGDDASGLEVVSDLKANKVMPITVKKKKTHTAYSAILLSLNGERTILSYRDSVHNLDKKNIPFSKLKSRWAYIAPGTIDRDTLTFLFENLAEKRAQIAVNPSKHFIAMGLPAVTPLFKHVSVVILNREEAAFLTGIRYEKEREIFKKLHELMRGIVVMTDGRNGAIVSDGTHVYRAGIFRERKLADRTGAGDAFGSGFLAGLISKNEACDGGVCNPDHMRYAIRLASANATSVVEYIGAKEGILTAKQFEGDRRWSEFPLSVSRF